MKLRTFDFWFAVAFTLATYGLACWAAAMRGWPTRIDGTTIVLVTFAAGLMGQGVGPSRDPVTGRYW